YLGLGKYVDVFVENEITLDELPTLTEDDLKELGLPMGPRKRIIGAIQTLADSTSISPERSDAFEHVRAAQAERRQLTVMFCDLVGSTALSRRLDPEDMGAVISAYQQLCTGIIEKWQGHVAKYMGDGLMAYFGYPIASELDAENAVRAALDLTEEMQKISVAGESDLAVRSGIATGLVMVGELIGEGAAQEEAVVGDAPNLAARLQAVAAPNTVVIAADTSRLITGLFELDPLGPQDLKGIAEPMPAWRVVGEGHAQSRFEAAMTVNFTPFVGRGDELARLQTGWHQARQGAGQVVLIGGEAGIGKSRLTQALREIVARDGQTYDQVQCSPHHGNTPLHPFTRHIEHAADIGRAESDELKLEKLEGLLVGTISDPATTIPILAAMLSIDIGTRYRQPDLIPRRRNEHLLHALAEHLWARATGQAAALIVEDAHWIDPSSQALLELLADTIGGHRLLLVITHRPEYEAPLPDGGHISRLSLSRFEPKAAAELVRAAAQGRNFPDDVLAEIIARTDGVPLFVEEMTRTVMESGVLIETDDGLTLTGSISALSIPETLRDSLMARLDRLGAAKTVAQIGACIGREFSRQLIAAVTALEEAELANLLDGLIVGGVVARTGAGADAVYTFSHALVQSAAYDSLLRRDRRRLHLAIAGAIEAASTPATAAEWAMLAEHYANGGDAMRALTHYYSAANSAAQTFAIREALALYDAALTIGADLAPDDDAGPLMDLRKARANFYFNIGRFADARNENHEYLALARAAGDRRRESEALAGLGWTAMWAEDFDAALEISGQAIALAGEIGETSILGIAHLTSTFVDAVSGNADEAEAKIDKTIEISKATGDTVSECLSYFIYSHMKGWTGDFQRGAELGAKGAVLARENGLMAPMLRTQFAQGVGLVGAGRYDEALALFEDGMALAEKIGDEAFMPRYQNGLGWLYVETGNFDQGYSLNQSSAEQARLRHHATGVEMTCFAEINMADAALGRGDQALAGEILDGVHRVALSPETHTWMKWRYTTHVFLSLGRLELSRGNPSGARDYAAQCLKHAEPTRSRKYIAGAWTLLGDCAVAALDWEEAEKFYIKANAMVWAIDHAPQI
ncbi:MAG: AAA family ATPase, partial [Alphaproteobacteria bacterium]